MSTTGDRQLVEWTARLRVAIVLLVRQLRQHAVGSFTPTQLSVLGSIHRHGPLSLGDVAVHEHLSLPTISKVVAALEADGVVERLSDDRDRRVCLVATTPSGALWIEDTRARRDAWLAARLAGLPAADQALLAAAVPVIERLIDEE